MPIGLAGSILNSEDLLKAAGPAFEGFSYHSYGATSQRCAAMGPSSQTTAEAALSEEFLSRASRIEAFYAALRDKYEPGKPLWLTDTADAACGRNPWASTFLDSFRYLDQLGRLAARGVQVHIQTRSHRATTACWTKIRSRRGPNIGPLCYGASSWERSCSIPGLRRR